jgi:ABC-type multidrug transport system fused ATPase/permease subunit
MKFYEPFKGDIYLRNSQATQNLKNIESKSLRNIIGYVGQEPVLLGRTIREVLGNDSLKT